MATIIKSQVVDAVAKETGLTKVAAGQAVNTVLDTITTSMKKGNTVQFTGFGSFAVTRQKARTGMNPQTGEKIKIKARKAPKFKAGVGLKKAVG